MKVFLPIDLSYGQAPVWGSAAISYLAQVLDGLVVSKLDCQPRGGVQLPTRAERYLKISALLSPLANSDV